MTGARMVKIRLADRTGTIDRYVIFDRDRHGTDRYYFRRGKERKIRFDAAPGTPEFDEEYRLCVAGQHPKQSGARVRRSHAARAGVTAVKGSLRWLMGEYRARSDTWAELDHTTQKRRITVLDEICDEVVSKDNPAKIGDLPYAGLRPRVVRVIRNRAPTPATANARVKALRAVFKFAIDDDLVETNPARDVEYRRSASSGYHTWTIEEVRQYEATHAIGSKPRLALALLMFTGQRRSDIVLLGKQHRRQGGLQFTQFKGRNKKPVTLWIPVMPILQAIIDATPSAGLAFLETKFGKSYTAKGFGVKFRRWCNKAGLPKHCAAHGLRKAGATIAAENGATPHQLMAIFGWKTLKEAMRYTEAAEQKRIAQGAMHLIVSTESDSPTGKAVSPTRNL